MGKPTKIRWQERSRADLSQLEVRTAAAFSFFLFVLALGGRNETKEKLL